MFYETNKWMTNICFIYWPFIFVAGFDEVSRMSINYNHNCTVPATPVSTPPTVSCTETLPWQTVPHSSWCHHYVTYSLWFIKRAGNHMLYMIIQLICLALITSTGIFFFRSQEFMNLCAFFFPIFWRFGFPFSSSSPPPLVRISLKITKLPNQHSMLGHHQLASETPFKACF